MLETRRCYYQLIIAILEKYGYEVITCSDYKTLYVQKHPESGMVLLFTDLEAIFLAEDIDAFIDDVEPVHIASWKIKTI
jgi:hypothetical protein